MGRPEIGVIVKILRLGSWVKIIIIVVHRPLRGDPALLSLKKVTDLDAPRHLPTFSPKQHRRVVARRRADWLPAVNVGGTCLCQFCVRLRRRFDLCSCKLLQVRAGSIFVSAGK
jgi:hypothetical protein